MKQRNFKLYVHISPSDKRYYGITGKEKVEHRWNNGRGYKTQTYFYRAIQKYGWDNFQHLVLFDNLTKQEAELLEQMYIALYDTMEPSKGYNSCLGGEGTNGFHHTEEWKQEHSKAMSGENNPNYNKEFSEEHKRKISERMSGENNPMYGIKGENHPSYGTHPSEEVIQKMCETRKGENNPFYGKRHSEETKRKQSQAKIGKNNPNYGNTNTYNARKVRCVELNEVYNSVAQAVREIKKKHNLKLNYTSINQRLNGTSNRDWYGKIEINGELIKLHWELVN